MQVKQNEKPDSNVSHSVRQHSLIHSSNFSSTLTTQCKVSHPRIVFFIRMPKCASTSFVSLLQAQAKILSFQFLFNPSGAYDWDNETTKKEAKLIQSKRGKVVYARHFYYVDFELYGLTNFTYITVIREPISRFISSYLYYHYSSKPHIQKMLKPKHKNESLLECVARKHNGCAHNWLTKYFCGHKQVCSTSDASALTTAKANMLHSFAAVGILEETDLTLRVFSKVLPGFFTVADLPKFNKNQQSMVLSMEEEETVLRINSADMELYAYARELLQTTSISCHVQVTR